MKSAIASAVLAVSVVAWGRRGGYGGRGGYNYGRNLGQYQGGKGGQGGFKGKLGGFNKAGLSKDTYKGMYSAIKDKRYGDALTTLQGDEQGQAYI